MLNIPSPSTSYDDVLTACMATIKEGEILKKSLMNEKETLNVHASDYATKAVNGMLFQIQQLSLVGKLTKKELINLYEYYFVKKRVGGFYDQQILSANDKCPFCGGIGHPANLDHFMPKNNYPQFSVLPVNLVPSCRDCNMGNKGSVFATKASEQIIHPFLDDRKFFDQQWVSARYYPEQNGNPSYIEYSVTPPQSWSQEDKDRVSKHFSTFQLKKRYSVQAASELGQVEAQIHAQKNKGTPNIEIKTDLLQPVISNIQFVNNWKRLMYQALTAYFQ